MTSENDWNSLKIEVAKGAFLNICKINVDGLTLYGDIDSSAGVDNTAYALRIRLNYDHDAAYWATQPDGMSKNVGRWRHMMAIHNSNVLGTKNKKEIYEKLKFNSQNVPVGMEVGLYKSDVTGDAAFNIMLPNSERLEPEKLGGLVESLFGWTVTALDQTILESLGK